MGRRLEVVVVAVGLLGLGCWSPPPAVEYSACSPGTAAAHSTSGPFLRLEAHTQFTDAGVAGVAFAVDQAGQRLVETVTGTDGVALMDAPNWDAGAVDITVLDPGGLGHPALTSYLGVPRGAVFTAPVGAPPGAKTTITGTIAGKVAAGDSVNLRASRFNWDWETTSSTFSVPTWGSLPTQLVGVEHLYTGQGRSSDFTNPVKRWFSVPVSAASGVTVDVGAATELTPVASVTGSVALPGGASGPLDGEGISAYALGAGSDASPLGAWVGVLTSVTRRTDRTGADWTLEYVNSSDPALRPLRTFFWAGPGGQGHQTAWVTLRGPPTAGQVIALPAPLQKAAEGASLKLPTPFKFAAPAAGVIQGFRLDRDDAESGNAWVVWALDGRQVISLPAKPTAASCIPALPLGRAITCEDSQLPAECFANTESVPYEVSQ